MLDDSENIVLFLNAILTESAFVYSILINKTNYTNRFLLYFPLKDLYHDSNKYEKTAIWKIDLC
jgi:hypothetical protein